MKIGIIVAMRKELELLKPRIGGLRVTERDGNTFYEGTMGRHDVVAMQCGIGKVNAAVGTVQLISAFKPELVINTGVAGGLGGVKVMDTVVGAQVCYHDVWCGGFDDSCKRGQVQGLPLCFEGDRRVVQLLEEESLENVHAALIVSGDQFVDTPEQATDIAAAFPQARAVDMESGAIAQTCHLLGTPFASIRVISDSPGAVSDNSRQYSDFWTAAPEHTLRIITALLQKL